MPRDVYKLYQLSQHLIMVSDVLDEMLTHIHASNANSEITGTIYESVKVFRVQCNLYFSFAVLLSQPL